jgi:DHA1 family inner membrane transport protein
MSAVIALAWDSPPPSRCLLPETGAGAGIGWSCMSQHSSPTSVGLPMAPLIALSTAMFIAQTTEFMPGGLTPLIAESLEVPLALAGQLVSVFALTVVLTTAPLAIVTRRVSRKPLIIGAFAIVCLANAAAGLMPTFEWVVIARIVGAMGHGLFWAVIAAYIADISPPERLGQAISITAAGGSLSGILGIPLGNALGQLLGWRSGFLVISAVGLFVAVALIAWLPAVAGGTQAPKSQKSAVRASLRLRGSAVGIAVVCVLILITVIGQTAFGPFVTAWLETVAGFDKGEIPLYLLVTGCAGAVGVLLAGRCYDRWPRATFATAGSVLAVAMALFPLAAGSRSEAPMFVVAIVVSIAFAGLPAMLQTRMMQVVAPARRGIAGAAQTTAFNVGIGGGAIIGGALVASVGLTILPYFAAAIAVLAVGASSAWEVIHRQVTERRPEPPVATPETVSRRG